MLVIRNSECKGKEKALEKIRRKEPRGTVLSFRADQHDDFDRIVGLIFLHFSGFSSIFDRFFIKKNRVGVNSRRFFFFHFSFRFCINHSVFLWIFSSRGVSSLKCGVFSDII